MKKHLVMIVGGYFPYASPTGKCAEQYISLIQENYNVDVICIARTNEDKYLYNEKNIYPTGCKQISSLNNMAKKNKFLFIFRKIQIKLINLFRQPNNLYWYVKEAYRKLEEIHRETPIDIVFSVGAPMASHCAANQFKDKHPEIRWVTYSVDSYAAQNNNKKKYILFEKNILAKADFNFLSEEIYNNSSFLYINNREKFETLPYVLSINKNDTTKTNIFDSDKINLLYAGRFYKKIRNPKFLLELIEYLDDNVVLHLYCTSDCDSLIKKYVSSSNGKIVLHDMVSIEEINMLYMSADFLVSVGNSLPEFKPSKIFEYISTCKPIINIYYENLYDDILDKYPLSLQICNNEDVKKISRVTNVFLKDNFRKTVAVNDISIIYEKYMPNTIRLKLVNKIIKEES